MASAHASPFTARIDWELLPSLRAAVRLPWRRSDPGWQETIVSDFDASAPCSEFEEVMPGLAVREVSEPEIFHIFFGRPN